MEEVIYSSDSQLRSLPLLVRGARDDLRLAIPVAWRLFRHNLQANYRQSWLGYIWLLLPPLATSLTWVYLNKANILQVGQTNMPYALYVLCGTLLWQVFVDSLNSPLQQLSSARNIMAKSRIPHETLLMTGLIEASFNFVVRSAVLLPLLIWFGARWHWPMMLAPLGVLSLMLLGFSIGLLLAPVGLLYQDVARALNLVVSFWFFLTPVIYPPPTQWPASLLSTLNPVTPLIVSTREWLVLGTLVPARGFATVVALSALALGVALLCYRLARPHLTARL